jgi:DNA-binding transcriptional LysR family regulator
MDLRQLRYFVAVAEEQHFGRAANRLHMAQPPLSRQIQALEKDLGFPLFVRSRRRVELTSAGAVLLQHSRRVFEAVDLAVHEARRAAAGESGRIAVGYLSSLAYSGLTELLRAFRARFPSVEVALRELPPAHQVDAVKGGHLDVGFVRGPVEDPALAFELVRREPLVVALPEDHPLAKRARVRLSSLAREPFVTFPRVRGPAFFDQLMALCRSAGFTPRIVQQAPQLDMMSLVAAGFGVAIVPASIRDVQRVGMVVRPIVGSPQVELYVVWRVGSDSPVLRGFLDVVRRVGVKVARAG